MYVRNALPLILVLTAVSKVLSGTILVPAEYGTIQSGLDIALTGDTVLVSPGIYYENLVWPPTDGIILLSEEGPTVTSIDGSSNERVIKIWQPYVSRSTIISGFTITHGYAYPTGGGSGCGGGGISCNWSSPTITDNVIIDNEADKCGGGICCWEDSYALIENNLIQGNNDGLFGFGAGGGGGIYAGYADVIGNVITGNNTAGYSYHAGGIQGGAYLQGNIIVGNCDDDHPAVVSPGVMESCIVSNNGGGGILLLFSGYTLTGCEISDNGDYGVHMYLAVGDLNDWLPRVRNEDTTYVTNCVISGNEGSGFVYSYAGPHGPGGDLVQIHYCSILDNLEYGVESPEGSGLAHAEYNWWGDASGPGGEGPGTGDEVSINVSYYPWLQQEGIGVEGCDSGLDISMSPNPFEAYTAITFELPTDCLVSLEVYDLSGRLVQTLVDCMMTAGEHTEELDGTRLSSGVYLIRLKSSQQVTSARTVLIR